MNGEGRVVLVTAASRGIGEAVARRLHGDGYRLALLARSAEVVELARELDAVAVQGSVTEPADLQRLVDEAVAGYGRVDGAVINTGHSAKGELLELTDEQWHAGLDLLLLLTVRLARILTPMLESRGGGALVNVSAFGAREPSLDFPISSALRAALGGFTKLYADRYAAAGIRMNAVLPGFVDSYPVDAATRSRIPAGRPARVDEIAATVAWLMSDDASYVTGQSLVVDGGLTWGF